MIRKGATYCLLGSSGVGKSTLINGISGKTIQETGTISESTGKGRHVTAHRELIVLPNGGLLIDNPGVREVGIAGPGEGVEGAFEGLLALAVNCRFKDCTHTLEKGCAVIMAMENGTLDESVFSNFHKIERERARFEIRVHEKKRYEKKMGKL
jgi:ribosome biogenesis GTPase